MTDLDLGVIGNCSYSALVDQQARVVWCCLPRFDGDAVFNRLLWSPQMMEDPRSCGTFEIDVDGLAETRQGYLENTAVLRTELTDESGRALEVVDFAPRFSHYGRRFKPMTLVRILTPLEGHPRIRIRLRPAFGYGAMSPQITHGSNHIRYVGPHFTLRLTTNDALSYILEEAWFFLEEPLVLILGPDEPLTQPAVATAREFLDNTSSYWREWVRHLAVPLEWQEAVIRAAITLKLCWFEETGAIVAAMTTSVPEHADSGRNWDYRYCWLRDAYFVVRALNRLGAIDIMEGFLRYLRNVVGAAEDAHLQPVYGIALERRLIEREVRTLPGYRGMGPVRVGNQAHEHLQHDVYGQVVLSTAQAFFDRRLLRPLDKKDFLLLERIGERAYALYDQPDAGLWELRTKSKVHTYSSVMCWAACDRLAKVAEHVGLPARAERWRGRAEEIRQAVLELGWNEERGLFAGSFGGDEADASMLLMVDVGFIDPDDERYRRTVAAVERELLRGGHLFRYSASDDFGIPKNAFTICTFWYIEAMAAMGRVEEAREVFVSMLDCRSALGLLSEDIDPITRELWGNFPQTYSMVGIINSATWLSRSWETAR